MIKHVHFVRKRLADGHVRWYVYAWRGGPQIMIGAGLKKPKLDHEALRKLAEASKPAPPKSAEILGELIAKWQQSPTWAGYSTNTKKTWGSYVRAIEEKWGKVPLIVIDDARMTSKIIDWQESNAGRPRAADLGVDVLKAVLKYGLKRGILQHNRAAGIGKIYSGGQREEIIWLPTELAAFDKKATEIGKEAVADALLLCATTGLRRQDLVSITWTDVQEFAIVKKALKSSRKKRRFASVPRVPELDSMLERLRTRPRTEGAETVLVTDGRAWGLDELTKAVADVRDAMGGVFHIDRETGAKRAKHLHDARGSYATKLMVHTDLGDDEIADIMAWSPDEVSRIRFTYVDRSAHHEAIGRRIARNA